MSFHKLNIRVLDIGPAPGGQVELSSGLSCFLTHTPQASTQKT